MHGHGAVVVVKGMLVVMVVIFDVIVVFVSGYPPAK